MAFDKTKHIEPKKDIESKLKHFGMAKNKLV